MKPLEAAAQRWINKTAKMGKFYDIASVFLSPTQNGTALYAWYVYDGSAILAQRFLAENS